MSQSSNNAKSDTTFVAPQVTTGNSGFFKLEKDEASFAYLAEYLKNHTGINLGNNPKNRSLMASRMISFLKEHSLGGYADLISKIKSGDKNICREFMFALTTNTTQFFREPGHFDFIKNWLPNYFSKLNNEGSRDLRVWCAAASTGQEPYTILMTILELLGNPRTQFWDLKFLATDIDLNVLDTAGKATYTQNEVTGVPPQLLQQYFTKVGTASEARYQIKKEFRDLLRLAQLNLVSFPYPFKHQFDIIFCRNVLIYFEQEMANRVVETMLSHLKKGGLLILGHSESGCMRSPMGKSISHAVFERK
jgi:chemotaxis protein methyltransferase CheR